ncbi:hypothetical protein Cpir12675_006517 [Ceratocystis pirilliformis]|uniref:H/ACA ribonucleoprotein complex non-core subunit NAF1 n=1 Tax=Ceratocystis pirilliformis TaxID=259994 RepID=A0ABR3YHR0_9PEZI
MSGIPGLGASASLPAPTPHESDGDDTQMADDPAPPANTTGHADAPVETPITSALEAMLNEYEPFPAATTQAPQNTPSLAVPVSATPLTSSSGTGDAMDISQEPALTASGISHTTVVASASTEISTAREAQAEDKSEGKSEGEGRSKAEDDTNEDENPQWEIDSNPYQSSSDSSSDSDSDSDNDSEDEKFELLGIEETARILMKAEGDSDDEGENSGKAGKQMRTKNEIDEQYAPRPVVVITPDMKIEPLGLVEHVIDNTLVLRGFTPAEYQVLDGGSVLCLADRRVIGSISEPLGKVQQPMYLVGFQRAEEIQEFNLTPGTKLYYSVAHANYVFTSALKNFRGSDASNIHDEEVGADEIEFSDDEKEAEYKRMKKQKRREKNIAKSGGESSASGLRNEVKHDSKPKQNSALNYDGDGAYRRLTRPPGFGTGTGQSYQPSHTDDFKPRDAGNIHGGHRGRGSSHRGGGSGARGGRGNHQGSWEPSHPQPPVHHQGHYVQPPLQPQPPQYSTPSSAYQPAPYTAPNTSAAFYAPQAPSPSSLGNTGMNLFSQFPAPPPPPPPNTNPTAFMSTQQLTAAVAALTAAGMPHPPAMPLMMPPMPNQQQQQQIQQQTQQQQAAALAVLNPVLLQLVMQQAAAQNSGHQNQGSGGPGGPGGPEGGYQ